MWHKVKLLQGTAGNLCSLGTIYVTNAAIKSKMNYIILAAVFDSCASLNLLPDIKIIAWMVNHTTLLQKWSTVHVAWMNYGCRLTRISISRIFDKAELNLTMWEAEGTRNFTDKFTSFWCIFWKKCLICFTQLLCALLLDSQIHAWGHPHLIHHPP